jgi:hypothetical protein
VLVNLPWLECLVVHTMNRDEVLDDEVENEYEYDPVETEVHHTGGPSLTRTITSRLADYLRPSTSIWTLRLPTEEKGSL